MALEGLPLIESLSEEFRGKLKEKFEDNNNNLGYDPLCNLNENRVDEHLQKYEVCRKLIYKHSRFTVPSRLGQA